MTPAETAEEYHVIPPYFIPSLGPAMAAVSLGNAGLSGLTPKLLSLNVRFSGTVWLKRIASPDVL